MRTYAIATLIPAILALALATPPPAQALTVSPPGAGRGESLILSLYTPGTRWGPGVTVDLGAGITTESVTVVTPELLAARITVGFSTALGRRDIVIRGNETVLRETGAFTVVETAIGGQPGGPPLLVNVLVNPGFELGNMNGWIPTTWSISTVLPHSGIYDAYDPGATGGGGLCLRQNLSPAVDSDDVTAFTFWLRQLDDFGIAQVIIFHQNFGPSVGVAFTNDDDTWTFEDFTSLRQPNDFITGCHICGFGGGAPTPDDSWADDFVLEVSGVTAVEPATWGAIKAALR